MISASKNWQSNIIPIKLFKLNVHHQAWFGMLSRKNALPFVVLHHNGISSCDDVSGRYKRHFFSPSIVTFSHWSAWIKKLSSIFTYLPTYLLSLALFSSNSSLFIFYCPSKQIKVWETNFPSMGCITLFFLYKNMTYKNMRLRMSKN